MGTGGINDGVVICLSYYGHVCACYFRLELLMM